MRFHHVFLLLGGLIAFALPASAVDMANFTREMTQVRLETKPTGNSTQLAMWTPLDYFVAYASAGKVTPAEVEAQFALLKPYTIFITECTVDVDDGVGFASEAEIRARAILRLADGTEVRPLTRMPTKVTFLVDALKKQLAETLEGEESLQVLIFPTSQDGKPLVQTSSRTHLTLALAADAQFGAVEFTWQTPFDALAPDLSCIHCHQHISPKWTYCPWCGEKQPEPGIAK